MRKFLNESQWKIKLSKVSNMKIIFTNNLKDVITAELKKFIVLKAYIRK